MNEKLVRVLHADISALTILVIALLEECATKDRVIANAMERLQIAIDRLATDGVENDLVRAQADLRRMMGAVTQR